MFRTPRFTSHSARRTRIISWKRGAIRDPSPYPSPNNLSSESRCTVTCQAPSDPVPRELSPGRSESPEPSAHAERAESRALDSQTPMSKSATANLKSSRRKHGRPCAGINSPPVYNRDMRSMGEAPASRPSHPASESPLDSRHGHDPAARAADADSDPRHRSQSISISLLAITGYVIMDPNRAWPRPVRPE
jgi:hypothetical protein